MFGRKKEPKVVEAIGIDFWPLERIPPVDERYIADCLQGQELSKGDTVRIPYPDGGLLFKVIFVWPDVDVVRVTQDTVSEISETSESKYRFETYPMD